MLGKAKHSSTNAALFIPAIPGRLYKGGWEPDRPGGGNTSISGGLPVILLANRSALGIMVTTLECLHKEKYIGMLSINSDSCKNRIGFEVQIILDWNSSFCNVLNNYKMAIQ